MRLICRSFARHVIDAQIISGYCAGKRVFIPRIELTPSDAGLLFTLRRRQFPVRLCQGMTMNKAQSQNLDYVGLLSAETCLQSRTALRRSVSCGMC